MTTSTATSPLKNNRESGVGSSNGKNQRDGLNGTRLERNMLQAKITDVLVGNLNGGNTSTNGDTLNGVALSTESLDQRNSPAHKSRVDVNQVDGNTNTRLDARLDILQGLSELGRGKVATTRQLNVVTSIESSSNKGRMKGGRSHTRNHNGSTAKHSRELGVNVNLVARLDKLGRELLDPVNSVSDSRIITVKDLLLVAKLVKRKRAIKDTSNDNTNTGTLLVSRGQKTKTRDTTGAKIDDVGRVELSSLLPVDRDVGNELDNTLNNAGLSLSEVRTIKGVVNRNSKRLGVKLNASIFSSWIMTGAAPSKR